MNIRDLAYFIAVAKYNSFGQAAKSTHVSQPALSMQIKKLEERLGITLFERQGKTVLITEIGQRLLVKAKQILQLTHDIEELAERHQDPFAGDIKLGAFPTLAPYLFPAILPSLMEEYSDLRILLAEEKTDDLLFQLKEGMIDAALLALPLPADTSTFVAEELFDEPFYLAVSSEHRLSDKDVVSNNDLKDECLLLLTEGHCLRAQALSLCQLLGVTEQTDFRATSLETLRQMVSINVGITLMPQLAMRPEEDTISYIPFVERSYSRTIGLVWRKSSAKHALLQQIAKKINSLELTRT